MGDILKKEEKRKEKKKKEKKKREREREIAKRTTRAQQLQLVIDY